jgi:hypothetical protein
MVAETVPTTMERTADFSPCRTYRYRLTRRWSDGPTLNVIGLNPSTADETQDDPTIRRCIGFAKSWGYHGLVMTNLCAFRATDPKDLWNAPEPAGPDNDRWLKQEAEVAGLVLAAWGANIMTHDAGPRMLRYVLQGIEVHCLGKTRDGHPRHPLYIAKATQPIPFRVTPPAAGDER